MRSTLATLQKEYARAKELVEGEQAHLAEVRRLQTELKEKSEQLKALASLALKHLDERCPVCAQTYDRDATRRRLEKIAKGSREDIGDASADKKLPDLLAALETKRKEVLAAELTVKSAEQDLHKREIAQEDFRKRASVLGLEAVKDLNPSALKAAIAEAGSTVNRLTDLQRKGEGLALGLAQSSEIAAHDELRFEAKSLRGDIEKREKELAASQSHW